MNNKTVDKQIKVFMTKFCNLGSDELGATY